MFSRAATMVDWLVLMNSSMRSRIGEEAVMPLSRLLVESRSAIDGGSAARVRGKGWGS